jgi:hypothetical protein
MQRLHQREKECRGVACDSMTCKVTLAASRQMLNASQDKTQWAQKTVREYRLKGDPETVRRENG